MKILFWGITLIAIAFFIHLAVWRTRLPKRQTKTLLQIFFGTLIAGLLLLWVVARLGTAPNNFVLSSLAEYLHIALLFLSLTFAYLITYSGVEAESPSLVMMSIIGEAGEGGLGMREFRRKFTNEFLIKPRIADLVLDKMVYLEGERYRLTPKGLLFARIFIYYRALLGAEKGG